MDKLTRPDSFEKENEAKHILNPSSVPASEQDDLEEDEALIRQEDVRYRSNSATDHVAHVKEISAPYAVPHYPIELEEQKKIVAQQIVLKELEERATHPHNEDSVGKFCVNL